MRAHDGLGGAWAMALLAGMVLWPATARAGDKAQAEAFFQQGRTLMEKGDFGAACSKFEASMAEDPSVGALLNLARCNEQRDRPVEAWRQYLQAAVMAEQAGQQRRADGARQYAERLERELPRLTVVVVGAAPGQELVWAGKPLDPAEWSKPFVVDPGVYQLEARADGRVTIRREVTVAKTGSTVVSIPALVPTPQPPAVPVVPTPKAPPVPPMPPPSLAPPAPVAPPPSVSTGMSGQQLAGWLIGGVGLASTSIGATLGITALLDTNALDGSERCPTRTSCSPQGLAERDAITSRAHASTAMLALGGAAVVSAAVLFLTTPDDEPEQTAFSLTPLAAPGVVALDLRWRF